MNFASFETLRLHKKDLQMAFKFKTIEGDLLHFIVNRYEDGHWKYPMESLAHQIKKSWPAVGILDRHDITQIYYYWLLRTWKNVNWEKINKSDEPYAKLWAYIKKSCKLKMRIEINNLKDGMRIPEYRQFFDGEGVDNFFSDPKSQIWFWANDEVLSMLDQPVSKWDHEQLNHDVGNALRMALNDTERLVVEFFYGIDGARKSIKGIAEYFGKSQPWVKTTKHRAIKKIINNQQVAEFLKNKWENM